MKSQVTAPCGLDCFNCQVFESNISDAMRAYRAHALAEPPEQAGCRGCRVEDGCRLHAGSCATRECVREHNVQFCFECAEFPCPKLQPAADGADRYPHNMKVYNLCRMKAVGVERWAEEEALAVRERYYAGKLVVGLGPVVR